MISTPDSTRTLDIDHPMQPGWVEAGLDIMEEPGPRRVITGRFGADYPNIEYLFQSIGDASRQLDSVRQTHERWNARKLEIGALALTGANIGEYKDSMCDPALIGRRVLWFAGLTTALYAAFDELHANSPILLKSLATSVGGVERFRKIGIDIWGKRQGGLWDSTADMDAAAKTIPAKVLERTPDADIKSRGEIDEGISYTFHPVGIRYSTKDGNRVTNFNTGIARRRRTDHIIRIPGLNEVSVMKESYGLILLDELKTEPKNETGKSNRQIILEAHRTPDKANFDINSAPAVAAGRVFEQGINDRGTTRKVVPLGAHYYMAATWDPEV
jgi:hypothetical protein